MRGTSGGVSRVLARLLRGPACLVAVELACVSEDGQVDGEPEFRADGCGAGLEKTTGPQKVSFKGVVRDNFSDHIFETATCDGDAKLKCDFELEKCIWRPEFPGCFKYPEGLKLDLPPKPAAPRLSHTFTLALGDTLCDPPAEDPKAREAYCHARIDTKIAGKTIQQTLYDACGASETPDVMLQNVTCCTVKANAETSSDTGSCSDEGTAGTGVDWTTGTGSTSWSGSTSWHDATGPSDATGSTGPSPAPQTPIVELELDALPQAD